MKAKKVFEEFTKPKDAYSTLGIGIIAKIREDMKKLDIEEGDYTIGPYNIIELHISDYRIYRIISDIKNIQIKYVDSSIKDLANAIMENSKSIVYIVEEASQRGMSIENIKLMFKAFSINKKSYENALEIALRKVKRTKEDLEYDEEYNTYIFIGFTDKKPVEINGKKYYEDVFSTENMIKIDKFDVNQLAYVPMMKVRAKLQYNDGAVYKLNVSKDIMDEESYSDIPDELRDIVQQYATKI